MIDCVCECTRVNVFACGPVHACVRACVHGSTGGVRPGTSGAMC